MRNRLLRSLVAGIMALLALGMPAATEARTQISAVSHAADVTFAYTEACYYTTASLFFGDFTNRQSGAAPDPRSTLHGSVFVYDNCNEHGVVEDFVTDGAAGWSFKFKGTQLASVHYTGTSTNGYPVNINLAFTALGQPHTETFHLVDKFGCPFQNSGVYQTSGPYSVAGTYVIGGVDYADGHAADYAVVFEAKNRALYACI